ncbi:MAG: polysaccharide biosynthesis/export family protein [Nonlabens sp.]
MKFFGVLIVMLLAVSCVSPKKIRYVQDIETLNPKRSENSFLKFQKGDLVNINLVSSNMESVRKFYKGSYLSEPTESINSPTATIYKVDQDGFIKFPVVGKVNTLNLTAEQLQELLVTKLKKFVNDIDVEVRLENFNITVLGDVQSPGTFKIPEARINVLQAIGLAGDLNITGDRKKVKIIRNEEESVVYSTLDLTSAEFISSDYYYLQQNDIVIVEPNKSKIQTSGFYNTASFFVSIASVLSTLIIVLVTNR